MRTATLPLIAFALSAAPSLAGSLTTIPVPPGKPVYLSDVSDDGRTVIGSGSTSYFYWTRESGVVYIGGIAPGYQGAGGVGRVSADGTRFAGGSLNVNDKAEASTFALADGFWVASSGIGGSCDITSTSAYGMSANGQVVVGGGYATNCGSFRAFRWDAGSGAIVALPSWFGWSCRANAVSADGSTVVGWQADNSGQWRPCLWKFNGTSWVQTRPAAPGGSPTTLYGEAQAASADGQVAVGAATIGGIRQPFRWTQAGGTVGLGLAADPTIPGAATDCSADATRILCFFRAGPPPTSGEGYMWIEGRGYVALETLAQEAGVAVPPEVRLSLPLAMSADALTIVGTGRDTLQQVDVTFVLDLRPGGGGACSADLDLDGAVSGADLGLLLGAWATSGPGDLNGDGTVTGADLGILLGQWGPCP
jgi:uncharacterized membrane protein